MTTSTTFGNTRCHRYDINYQTVRLPQNKSDRYPLLEICSQLHLKLYMDGHHFNNRELRLQSRGGPKMNGPSPSTPTVRQNWVGLEFGY